MFWVPVLVTIIILPWGLSKVEPVPILLFLLYMWLFFFGLWGLVKLSEIIVRRRRANTGKNQESS